MAGFGENLRREREMRGISLREIADTTKINIRFLEALEYEEFSSLPGGIYVRGFIRAYANYVGIDAEKVLADFSLVAPPPEEEDFSRLGVSLPPSKKKKRTAFLAWSIAALLLAGGYVLFHYAHRSAETRVSFGSQPSAGETTSRRTHQAVPTKLHSSAVVSPAGKDVSSVKAQVSAPAANPPVLQEAAYANGSAPRPTAAGDAANPSEQAASSAQVPPTGASSPQGKLVLKIAATEPCWVEVEADGKKVLERILNPNEVKTLTANNSFDVKAGNAQGVKLALDGIALKPLGSQGEVKEIRLTRNSLKQRNP